MTNLTAVDLFAGLGGNSEGATQAGVRVLRAANHWPAAVECHRLNHPDTEHDCQDLQQANFYDWPDFDVMLASPACQGHSRARGKERAHHDATRSTAWAVVSCAEAKRPKFLVVENVPDFLGWQLYPEWSSCLEKLGYTLNPTVLNAADVGVPQERVRLFVVGVHREVSLKPVVVPQPRLTHTPAAAFIDFTAGTWSPVEKPGRSPATLERVRSGRVRYGERFLAPYYGSGSGKTGRSISRPVGTITTRDRWSVVDGDRMRILTARENARAQGFRDDYILPRSHREAVFMVGNAVPPALTKHVCLSIQSHLEN